MDKYIYLYHCVGYIKPYRYVLILRGIYKTAIYSYTAWFKVLYSNYKIY